MTEPCYDERSVPRKIYQKGVRISLTPEGVTNRYLLQIYPLKVHNESLHTC